MKRKIPSDYAPLPPAAGETPDLTSALAAAMEAHRLEQFAVAEAGYQRVLSVRPDHPIALGRLGRIHLETNRPHAAGQLLRRAQATFWTGLGPPHTMGERHHQEYGDLLMSAGNLSDAISINRFVRQKWPGPKANDYDFATMLLADGQLAEGWRHYEARFWAPPLSNYLWDGRVPQPRWSGQALNGETVVLYAEQGFGDTLQFSRYAPAVAAAGGQVVLVVPRSLQRLMGTLDGVSAVVAQGDPLPWSYRYHCPMMSLPAVLGTRLETIPAAVPYLRAPDPAVWAGFLSGLPGLKVGLVWSGQLRPLQPRVNLMNERRSVPLVDLMPLLEIPGISWFSLQVGPAAGQLRELGPSRHGGAMVHDPTHRIQDFADTAALIAGLDLVISVDTSVAHLAGALGKQVWVLLSRSACWRWLRDRSDSPWYPTARLFRQRRPGDWSSVIADIAVQLRALIAQ